MSEPILTQVTRYRCPHCQKLWSKKRTAVEHIARCWYNPAARSCKTCSHFQSASTGCGEYGCNGCGSAEFCYAGVDLNSERDEPGLPIHCPKWEAIW